LGSKDWGCVRDKQRLASVKEFMDLSVFRFLGQKANKYVIITSCYILFVKNYLQNFLILKKLVGIFANLFLTSKNVALQKLNIAYVKFFL